MSILDLSVEDDYESDYESDCESVEHDYILLLKNNNQKYQEHISFKKGMILKSLTDYSMFQKSPSLKTKLKNTLRKIKSF